MNGELAPETGPNRAGFELGCDGPMVLVVGVDGSDTSWRALSYAMGQARRQGSSVAVVYAKSVSPPGAGTGGVVDPRLLDGIGEELCREISRIAREVGVRTTFTTVAADPAAALHAVAEKMRADAIIVGASQGRKHRLYGSTAVRAVRQGKWPVTVVP